MPKIEKQEANAGGGGPPVSTTNFTYASLSSGSGPHRNPRVSVSSGGETLGGGLYMGDRNPRVSVSSGGGSHVRGRDPPRTLVSSIGGPHVRGKDTWMEEIDLTNSDDNNSVDTDVVGDVGSADGIGGDSIITNTTSTSKSLGVSGSVGGGPTNTNTTSISSLLGDEIINVDIESEDVKGNMSSPRSNDRMKLSYYTSSTKRCNINGKRNVDS